MSKISKAREIIAFSDFLQRKGLWDAYMREFLHTNQTEVRRTWTGLVGFKEFLDHTDSVCWIQHAFRWSDTFMGYSRWEEIHYKWRAVHKKMEMNVTMNKNTKTI